MTIEIASGAVEPIRHFHDVDGALVPGSTLKWCAVRESDGYGLITSGNIFALIVGGNLAPHLRALPESAAQPGVYESTWNTSGIAVGQYTVTIVETAPTARTLAQCEIRIGTIDAQASVIDVVASSIVNVLDAIAAVGTAVAALPAAVWNVVEGGATGTLRAALSKLRRRLTNGDSMSATGLISHKADDGTTEATTQVRGAAGNPYVPASGSATSRDAET